MTRLAAGLVLTVAALVAAAGAFGWLRTAPVARAAGAAAGTATVARRDFVRIVRLSGTTEATDSYVVAVPRLTGTGWGPLTVTYLVKPGTAVKPGDLLVEFDRQAQETAALERRAEYRDLEEQITRKRAEHEAARVKDDSELAQTRNEVEKYELEVLKNEMLSKIKAEQNTQSLEEARARQKALEESYGLKRQAAAADLRILEIRRDRAKAAMEHSLRNSEAMTVRSPLAGLAVSKTTWKGNGLADIEEGDEARPGQGVLEIVNQAAMRVRARVNQADLPHVRDGQPAVVRLDAYPGFSLPGRLRQMAPIGVPGGFSDRVRTFDLFVEIDGSSPNLLPDLTAAVDVEVERVRDALVVPRDAVTVADGRATVRVRDGSGSSVREVRLGPMNEIEAVVVDGLREGEVVVR